MRKASGQKEVLAKTRNSKPSTLNPQPSTLKLPPRSALSGGLSGDRAWTCLYSTVQGYLAHKKLPLPPGPP